MDNLVKIEFGLTVEIYDDICSNTNIKTIVDLLNNYTINNNLLTVPLYRRILNLSRLYAKTSNFIIVAVINLYFDIGRIITYSEIRQVEKYIPDECHPSIRENPVIMKFSDKIIASKLRGYGIESNYYTGIIKNYLFSHAIEDYTIMDIRNQ